MKSAESLRGRKPEEGRDYWIDFGDACGGAMAIEENGAAEFANNQDVSKWTDYLIDGFKWHIGYESIDYGQVVRSLKFRKKGFDGTGRWQIGPIHAYKGQGFGLSLYDRDGQKIIEPDDKLVVIDSHRIIFGDTNELIKPTMINRSLQILADGLAKTNNPPLVMGLTHPRLARISQRWGFLVSERPFAPVVYEFVDQLQANPEWAEDDRNRDGVIKAARQSMVYQYTEEFIRQHHS